MSIKAHPGFVLAALLFAAPAFGQSFVGEWTATAVRVRIISQKAALQAMPLEQRAAVTLCLVCGFSHSEATKILGAALGTVKSHVLRGRERLREAIERKT